MGIVGFSYTATVAQVSPNEMLSPRSRTSEQRYLAQLTSLKRAIDATSFAMPFTLARYLDARSGRAALDTDGIEFVEYQSRSILKISGVYKAAFDSRQVSENERRARVFEDVVVPILRGIAETLPPTIECDGIGFEVLYGVRDANKDFEFEGREVLSILLSRDDAFAFAHTKDTGEQQNVLSRSDVFVNGKPLMIRLDGNQVPDREAAKNPVVSTVAAVNATPTLHMNEAPGLDSRDRIAIAQPNLKTEQAIWLQRQFGAQTKAVMNADSERLHPAPDKPPLFEVEGDRLQLHFTMMSTLSFDEASSSIYRRAGRNFDQFLAPELKGLLTKLPGIEGLDAVQFSVVNKLNGESRSSETVDYICPVTSLRAFVANQITSQELIDQSTVLVNGVRIGVTLQVVE
jgi:hypothetical protein